ncbi:glycosyl transferase family 1 [Desulfotomaculum copahuensis]|uniref:Glycosyl transferase family 1 n=1 Tax=Desulfotomaculum copahuensis TaxID=1838280 RepID=A0A1B7LGW1_9FIRM|nr:glycosyltransferase family 4 protein [Desulfotomaculum copahuensis]OAT85440.1 glycosyl transferase family 1 [Desulfotomaculum copahuensis]
MRVLMLSWEYPPRAVGGLAQHVYDLTGALAAAGEEVHLITCGAPGLEEYEEVNGVHVHRVVPYQISAPGFVTWVAQLNVAMLERAIPIVNELNVHLLHAHDWLVAYAARALKHACRLPLVATIHATEYGRNYGLHNDTQRHISDIEWWLTFEAWRVICCSHYMRNEVRHVFQLPDDKVGVIPNGVNPSAFAARNPQAARDHYAAPDEQIVFYVGRLVREKGVQVLLDAVPEVLSRHPRTKFVIAGKGPYAAQLHQQAVDLGIASRVYFTGYVDDKTRNSLYGWAAAAVFPSLYEPFGIVALEGMAARAPVIVADTGGLSEIVEHGVDGLKFYPGNSHSLADMICWLLQDGQLAEKLRQRAFRKVQEQFNWRDIARQTGRVYRGVWQAYRGATWYDTPRAGRLFNRVTRMLARA